ncbi:MAG TPA: carboxypeptidase regulatory-like domain-containing protein [Candidatus Acidoferrales bacterium]|nr:carboxypeptidase regulatory-like domain-containing protein [Candidatus Acidoferrales bacterium]
MKTRPLLLVLALALPLAIIGCSKKESSESAEPPAPKAVVDQSTAGSITGAVKLDGAAPAFKPIDMSAEAACVQSNSKPVLPPIVITGDKGSLANAVVYVKSGLGSYRFDVPASPATLTQKGCMYEPRVVALMTRQTLEIKNDDPTIHNVHAMPRENRAWNKSEPVGDPPIEASFTKPELAIPVACNIHPWMRAYFFVFAHPYFAVTSKSGEFELKNLPPGTYTIEAWHERFGTQDVSVTIAPKESKSISFTFKPAESH